MPSDRVRACIAAALASQLACTSSSTIALPNAAESLRPEAGFIVLADTEGDSAHIAPESRIAFLSRGGQRTATVEAGLLCRMKEGIAVREERQDSCATATPLIAWEDLEAADVETFDGAASVAITSGVVVVVAAAVVVLLGGAKSLPSSSGSKASGGGSAPRPSGGGAGSGGGGGGAGPGGGGGAGPYVPGSHGNGFHGDVHGRVGGPILIFPMGGFHSGQRSQGGSGAFASQDDGSIFSRTEARRATVRGLVGIDGGGCLILGSCLSLGLRGGVRLLNIAEITLGLRALGGFAQPGAVQAMPVLGLTLHGEFPTHRSVALAIGAQVGTSSAMSIYVDTLLGVRVSPARGLWLGIYPARPTYVRRTEQRGEGWVVQSSLDVAYDF